MSGLVNANVDYKVILALGAVGLAVYWVLSRDAAKVVTTVGSAVKDTAKAVGTAVNPLNNQNAAYSTVNAIGRAVGENDHEREFWTLGGQIYDWTHGTRTTEGIY